MDFLDTWGPWLMVVSLCFSSYLAEDKIAEAVFASAAALGLILIILL